MNAIRIKSRHLVGMVFVAFAHAVVLLLPVQADTHDDLVYQRYSRKLTLSRIPYEFDMKFPELGRPATQQDVENGAAVFTFEGLGLSRVWKLPKCPVFADWPSLKDQLSRDNAGGMDFCETGYVCQAEELQIDGRWKRYFGLVCEHGVAVVSAENIHLSLYGCGSAQEASWIQLPGGIDFGILGPLTKTNVDAGAAPTFDLGDPLLVELYLRNRRGITQPVMGNIYRDEKSGEPAFRNGIKFLVGWAPYNPKTPDQYYPRLEDFKPVLPIRTNIFVGSGAGPILETGESMRDAVFDIRDWFAVNTEGYYNYHFEFDLGALGLSTNETYGPGRYIRFNVGPEPLRVTPEVLNQHIPPFGGADRAEQLGALIKRSLGANGADQPKPSSSTVLLIELNQAPIPTFDEPSDEPEFVRLWRVNKESLNGLKAAGQDQPRVTLEALMEKENALPMKLLLASEAASLGSERGALFLLKCMHNTDYEVARNTHKALRHALYRCGTNPPIWLQELTMAALADDRYVAGASSDVFPTMSFLADEGADLTYALGYLHCTNSVPFLIEMTKKTHGRRGPVMALGNLGDSRAIPVLLALVRQRGPLVRRQKGRVLDDGFSRPVVALGQLHAKEAVPVLLEYLEHPEVIEALEEIGDTRTISPLQKVVSAKGWIDKAGVDNDPELAQRRLAVAQIALASLEPKDRTASLCELLTDASFDQFQRRSVVWRLGDRPDPRAIPFLAKAIKTDPSGNVVNQAITVLAVFKYKAAVDALIGGFDVDFRGKTDWKRAYTPEMFRRNIADSLSQLTQQHIGADKQQWLDWWRAHRDTVSGLE